MAKLFFTFQMFLSTAFFNLTHPVFCDFHPITGDDAKFCQRDLHVIYPDIGDVSCMCVTNCFGCPRCSRKVQGSPWIRYSHAEPEKLYTLIMVDPDAPSRSNPIHRFWRHWLITDIPGDVLLQGKVVTGTVTSPYYPPSPPAHTGYHRYQFMLYVQQPGISPSILHSERSLGPWDLYAFVHRCRLGDPVATTQFMTRNPHL
ncbi:PREDICTED: phosphatidylethanolamine-binding protein 4 [Nanorana parkeri]|uniref:phosphatidylethanolamine-binding protein 4 n=1 Tax=Nanorana parkeri TaxID=125878 RepID=UPI00085494CB|nr:PREDICTED: phosphatidylethanolamine-binding protein 4 [Nanorana parkeri]